MRREFRFIFFFAAIFLIIIIGIMFGEQYTMTISAIYPLGAIAMGFWGIIEISIPIMRGMTTRVICSNGHYSIRPDDVKHVPWHCIIEKDEKNKGKDKEKNDEKPQKVTINMSFMFTGSIHIDNFFTCQGRITDPIIIFPSIYEGKEENNYHSYANLYPTTAAELDKGLQDILKLYSKRVNEKTPILFGCTSHIDGSATTENLNFEMKMKELSKNNTVLLESLKDMREEIVRNQEIKKKEYIFTKEPMSYREGGG